MEKGEREGEREGVGGRWWGDRRHFRERVTIASVLTPPFSTSKATWKPMRLTNYL